MKKVKIVIGANFGDEGKGLMTDYFCDKLAGKVLNVRFNGTSQAGHTVERDGVCHVFSHFGSGSLVKGVVTYLSSDFFFNPVSFFEERLRLEEKGINPSVYLCNESEVITIYDVFFNCIIEEARGKDRHGSCGAGLWEAVNRSKAGYVIKASDFYLDEKELKKKLLDIRDKYYGDRFVQAGVEFTMASEWYDIWYSDIALGNYMDLFYRMKDAVVLTDEKVILNRWHNQVYEGAQGLLLDWDNREYMPNLTASYTGSRNVIKLLKQIDDEVEVEVCYVTRTYFTRHGAGRFETETTRENLDSRLIETTNITNRWQGEFRWGYFDKDLFLNTIGKDSRLWDDYRYAIKRTVAFTHANCTDEQLLMPDGRMKIEEFVKLLPTDYKEYYCCQSRTAKGVETKLGRGIIQVA